MMRKTILIAGVLLSLLCGCTRIKTEYVDVEKDVPVSPLTTYSFDGKSYSVHSLFYSENEDYLEFLIAREPEAPYTSYLMLSVMKDHLGKEIDFSDYAYLNRVDYLVIFEDINHYYPSEYAPRTGTFTVKKSSNGFGIDLDAKYIDGKSIKFNYDGVFLSLDNK